MPRKLPAVAAVLLLATNVFGQSASQDTYRRADLPPLLEFLDGTPVKSQEDWTRRRAEIARLMIETFIGTFPKEVPAILNAEVLQEQKKDDGSTRRQIRLTLDTKNKATFEMWVWVPKGDGPFPILLTAPRFYQIGWAEIALARGYIVCIYPGLDSNQHEAAYPDYENVWEKFRAEYPEATWTEIAIKGWLASRAIDYLLDPKNGYSTVKNQIAIIGWSRYGKQSLIAAAFDERITCVVARSSGSPGAAPYRFESYDTGGEMPIGFPGDWFLQSLRRFDGREDEMPIDAHGWLALIAPRRCALDTAYNDDGDLSFAVERAYAEGRKVYEFLGQPENLYLDYRIGGHGPLTDERRVHNIDWIDSCFGRGTTTADAFPKTKLLHQFDWSAWKAKQTAEDLQLPPAPARPGDRAEITSRVNWMLGRTPEQITPPAGQEPFPTRQQEIAQYGEDRDPDRWSCPDTARVPVVFGEGVRGSVYYSTKTQGAMPVVIWLHPYSWSVGYAGGCDVVIPWGKTAGRTAPSYIASRGFAVVAFDQIGYGTRLLEGRDFYEQYPQWSKLGRTLRDVRAAVDFIVDGKGQSQRELPTMDKKQIYALGYSLGGMVALYSTALDERISGVACFCGFTPMRTDTDAKPTGGIRRLWQWHGLLPKLGLYNGREQAIPYDYDDLFSLIAPRPCLIVSPQHDRNADLADVTACVQRAADSWGATAGSSSSAGRGLVQLTPDDINRFQDAQHDVFLNWLSEVLAAKPTP